MSYFFRELRIGLPLLVACVGVWLGMHTIQKLPLVHVFIEDSLWWQDLLSVGAWCCIAWPLISRSTRDGNPTLAQRLLPLLALIHAWLILFDLLPALSGWIWLPFIVIYLRKPLGRGDRHAVATTHWLLVLVIWSLLPLTELAASTIIRHN